MTEHKFSMGLRGAPNKQDSREEMSRKLSKQMKEAGEAEAVVEAPVVEEPVVEKPVAEEPVAEEPVAEAVLEKIESQLKSKMELSFFN
jgi:hypothetical protein